MDGKIAVDWLFYRWNYWFLRWELRKFVALADRHIRSVAIIWSSKFILFLAIHHCVDVLSQVNKKQRLCRSSSYHNWSLNRVNIQQFFDVFDIITAVSSAQNPHGREDRGYLKILSYRIQRTEIFKIILYCPFGHQ